MLLKIISKENFGSSFRYLFDESIVDLNNFTYSELVSSANFEVINNPTLCKNLTNYYLNFSALNAQDNLLGSIS
tara:strand:+ start:2024 stop:2245 length:222 start_codon:yes stop_codon:yes gene_type:complete